MTVFQQPVLLRRSVMANIRIGQKIRGTADPDREAEAWLQRLGLAGLAHATARTLSAGEAQRVALARALVVGPAVVLLDEPTGNLDPYNVRLIEEIVRADNAERGTTVVLVTHDVFQAKRLAHRTGLMIGGRIVELADTAAFFAGTPAAGDGGLPQRANWSAAAAPPSRHRRGAGRESVASRPVAEGSATAADPGSPGPSRSARNRAGSRRLHAHRAQVPRATAPPSRPLCARRRPRPRRTLGPQKRGPVGAPLLARTRRATVCTRAQAL